VQSTDLYQIAYIDYTKGNYALAIAGFREFLRLSPTSELAEKAQYWIAESHFSQGRLFQNRGEKERSVKEFEQAVEAFRRVYVDHPRGDRVPAAAYKEALTRLELSQQELAVGRLQWLVDYYPNTEEAAKAREDLARIRKR
jgi:TolA-binding protein